MRSDHLNHARRVSSPRPVSSGGAARLKKKIRKDKSPRKAASAKQISSAPRISEDLAFGGGKSISGAPSSSKEFQLPSPGSDEDNDLVAKHKAVEAEEIPQKSIGLMKGEVFGEEEIERLEKRLIESMNDAVARAEAMEAQRKMNGELDPNEEIRRLRRTMDEKELIRRFNSARPRFTPFGFFQIETSSP